VSNRNRREEAMAKSSTSRAHGPDDRLAVLIDADNVQAAVIEGLLAEVAKFGVASVKRIYGNWTSDQMGQWKTKLLRHSLNPVQQFAYTSGKNATDSSLIIDAMDLLYTRRFDGFCLVSSDSDFTRLAQRLREEGLIVYGFGERKTPEAFVAACDKFVYTELLLPAAPPAKPAKAATAPAKKATVPVAASATKATKNAVPAGAAAAKAQVPPTVTTTPPGPSPLPVDLIRKAIDDASDDSGWAPLASVGHYVLKLKPDFDPRLYGHKKLSEVLRRASDFVVEERGGPGPGKMIFVRAA
jgi:hypothetical protein